MPSFYSAQGAAQSSKSMDWATPRAFFKALDEEFHFDVDVCASDSNHLCDRYMTIDDNCLITPWGGVCFMNPPYGRDIGRFVKRALNQSRCGAKAVCLIPARTDTSYWHDYIFPYAAQIRFVRGRLHFNDGKDAAPFPSAVIVFDGEREGMMDVRTMGNMW